jgi:hypothetical protein
MTSFVNGFILACAIVLMAAMSYAWSYTETTFGGTVGFVSPVLLLLTAFWVGVNLGSSKG